MTLLKDVNGNWSTKRVVGIVTYTVGLAMAIVTGFKFYNVDTLLILTILGNGTVLLGIGTFEKWKGN
jgi:hypothetical protein